MLHLKKQHLATAVAMDLEPKGASLNVSGLAQSMGVLDLPNLRFADLMAATGLKKSTLWAIQDPHSSQFDETFPPSYRLTARTRVWNTAEIVAWIYSKRDLRSPSIDLGMKVAKGF